MARHSYIYASTAPSGGERILLGQHADGVPLLFKVLASAEPEICSETGGIVGQFPEGVTRVTQLIESLGNGAAAGCDRGEFRRGAETTDMVLRSKRLKRCTHVLLDVSELGEAVVLPQLLEELRDITATVAADPVGAAVSEVGELNPIGVDAAAVARVHDVGLMSFGNQ